jgi:hypothetical protein
MYKDIHLVVCINPKALEYLLKELYLIGISSKKGSVMSQGDALVARDELLEAGFVWGKDFYLKTID